MHYYLEISDDVTQGLHIKNKMAVKVLLKHNEFLKSWEIYIAHETSTNTQQVSGAKTELIVLKEKRLKAPQKYYKVKIAATTRIFIKKKD